MRDVLVILWKFLLVFAVGCAAGSLGALWTGKFGRMPGFGKGTASARYYKWEPPKPYLTPRHDGSGFSYRP